MKHQNRYYLWWKVGLDFSNQREKPFGVQYICYQFEILECYTHNIQYKLRSGKHRRLNVTFRDFLGNPILYEGGKFIMPMDFANYTIEKQTHPHVCVLKLISLELTDTFLLIERIKTDNQMGNRK